MAESRTQPDYRRSMTNKDRFGRRWLVVIELKTGDPCVPPLPAGWNDPLNTPPKYVMVPRDDPRTVRLLFQRWIEDLRREHRDYQAALHRAGNALYGEAYKESEPPTRRMLEITGPRPLPLKLIERAARGDKGLLGLAKLERKDARLLGRDPEELERQRQLAAEMGPVPTGEDEVQGPGTMPDELTDTDGVQVTAADDTE
jgi:hypothetical protein